MQRRYTRERDGITTPGQPGQSSVNGVLDALVLNLNAARVAIHEQLS